MAATLTSQRRTKSLSEHYGILTVLGKRKRDYRGLEFVQCRCVCGRKRWVRCAIVPTYTKTKSCRCDSRGGALRSSHGMRKERIYHCWSAMKSRCLDVGNHSYKNYGGRGIRVCKRWLVFDNFQKDMGPMPEGMTIDRINNDGNYSPSNCRWIDAKSQAQNRRSTKKIIMAGGRVTTISELASCCGKSYNLIWRRLRAGWTIEEATSKNKNSRSKLGGKS